MQEPPFPGGREHFPPVLSLDRYFNLSLELLSWEPKAHALLTQVQSGLVECLRTATHHVVRGTQSMGLLGRHFLAGRMFPLHSFTARPTGESMTGG